MVTARSYVLGGSRLVLLGSAVLLAACRSPRGKTEPEASEPSAPPTITAAPRSATPKDRIPAFPGAEGFGAGARGGRGGRACVVRTLARSGPGSLQQCLDASGPRIVTFAVSGVIPGPLEIRHGQLTIAGQTATGGITIDGGLVCDNVYDPNDCHDVVIRHLRLRRGTPDSLRIGGAHDVVVDHCSLAAAEDENLEITRSSRVTIQYSVIAEPRGDHYKWGGVLLNYSKDVMPLDGVSIHHDVWNGVSGRLPEISCEENGDGPGKSRCTGHVMSLEISNNVYWDVSDPIWFNRCTGNNEGNGCAAGAPSFAVKLNLVGNRMMRRSSADAEQPMVEPALLGAANAVYARDNVAMNGARRVEVPAAKGAVAARHAFPPVTLVAGDSLVAHLAKTVGPWPRDAMDARLAGYLTQPVDRRPVAWKNERGLESPDAVGTAPAAPAPPDADGDGMPDDWEKAHGLDPAKNDGDAMGQARGCAPGTSALECYVNELAESRVGK